MVVCVRKRAKKPENRRIRRDMEQYKKEFIEFMIDCNVLKFGDFVTKSGRKTPFLSIQAFTEQVPSSRDLASIMLRL